MILFRRLVLALLLVAAAWVLIRPPHRATAPPAGFVVVDYWEKWTGEEAALMQEIVDDFNNTLGKQDKIFVRYLSMSRIERKTMVAAAAGVGPDIAGLWDETLPQFASLGALLPLDDLAAAQGITRDLYKPVFWKECCYQGHLYALVATGVDYALHYNKRIFYENAARLRAAGLDPTRAPRTLAELDRYAQVLDAFVGDGARPPRLERAGYMPMEPIGVLNHTCCWFGGELFDETTGRFTLTTPQVLRTYNWIRSYAQRLGPELVADFRSSLGSFDSPQNSFVTGKLAMELQGPWMANTIYRYDPDMSQVLVPTVLEPYLPRVLRAFNYAWGVAPMPSAVAGQSNVTYVGADLLVIPRAAKHPREAFEFMAFVNRQEEMEKLSTLHCKPSPLRRCSEHFLLAHPNPYIAVFDELASSPNAHGAAQVEIWPQANDELANMAQEIYLGDAAAGRQIGTMDILRRSQQRLQQEYDRFRQSQALRGAGH